MICPPEKGKATSIYPYGKLPTYCSREEKGSNAEVDFLVMKNSSIVPVEVKSGVKGGMKSLHAFLQTHPNSPSGLKISQGMQAEQGQLQEIPLYGVAAWIKPVDTL